MSLNEYIDAIKTAVQILDDYGLADSIEPESEVRKNQTAVLYIKVILTNKSELYVREYLDGLNGVAKLSYSYQYQAADKSLVFRYDNSKHKPALGFDEHKHQRDGSIIPCQMPSIDEVVDEVIAYLG